MSQPTPGPYTVHRRWSNGCEICPYIVSAEDEWVAEVVGAPHLEHPRTLPTAALLAASWELREVLAGLIAAKDEKDANGDTPRYREMKVGAWERAREALAKADGKGDGR